MSGVRAQVARSERHCVCIVPQMELNDSAQAIPWSALLSSPRSLPSSALTDGMHWGALLVWCKLGCVEWVPLDWREHKKMLHCPAYFKSNRATQANVCGELLRKIRSPLHCQIGCTATQQANVSTGSAASIITCNQSLFRKSGLVNAFDPFS